MNVPRKLVDYPWVVVRVDCTYCGRHGVYRLARLAARYGPEQSLEGLLADLAHDCPWWRTNPRKYEPRCMARFTDLERNLPPPDLPYVGPRRKQPSRESVPKQPATHAGMGHSPMLSGWPHAELLFVCAKCRRRDVLIVASLLEHGDVRLTDLVTALAGDCPRRRPTSIADWCGAGLEQPQEPEASPPLPS